MKVYIETNQYNVPCTVNHYLAWQGFHEMGFETRFFKKFSDLQDANREDVVCGYVGTVKRRLRSLGIAIEDVDYPEELTNFLGRKVWSSTINEINNSPELWPVFIKSKEGKVVTGTVIRSPKDLIGCGIPGENFPVYCSTPIDIVTEWRSFVRYGEILDVRHYRGDWTKFLDPEVVRQAVKDYTSAPAGCSMDFALTSDGKTVLIEVNDGYSLGAYGLFYIDYAKLLSARWAELTGTEDECRF